MLHSPVLSIILPVFNGEAFIRRTIQSVLEQELEAWELIVVNDGSTDRSEAIITEFCALDARITKISQKNKGLSAARNAGYLKATGKYIVFLDADDYVEPNYYKELVASTEESGADFVVSGYIRDFIQANGKIKSCLVHFHKQFLDIENDREKLIDSYSQMHFYNVYIHVWNKIYRHDFLLWHGIVFDESIRYAEDVPYNIECLKYANSIQFLDMAGYHYTCHQAERLTSTWRSSLIEDNCRVYRQIVDYEQKHLHLELSEIASGVYLRSCYLTLEKAMATGMTYPRIKEIIQNLFSMPALTESLTTLQESCRFKEFLVYRLIWNLKMPVVVYISVKLRKCLKRAMGR